PVAIFTQCREWVRGDGRTIVPFSVKAAIRIREFCAHKMASNQEPPGRSRGVIISVAIAIVISLFVTFWPYQRRIPGETKRAMGPAAGQFCLPHCGVSR